MKCVNILLNVSVINCKDTRSSSGIFIQYFEFVIACWWSYLRDFLTHISPASPFYPPLLKAPENQSFTDAFSWNKELKSPQVF